MNFQVPSRRGAFLASMLVLVAVLLAAFATLRVQGDTTQAVVHTRGVLDEIDQILSIVQDVEIGQSGYLLTGDTRFLTAYQTAKATLPLKLNALERLGRGHENQSRALTALRSELQEMLAEWARSIALRDAGRQAEAVALVHSDRDRRVMEQLRVTLAAMRVEEERNLTQGRAQRTRLGDLSIGVVGILGGLALALLWLLRRLMARDAARIRWSEERLATTLTSIGDAVIATDAHGCIERMNPVAEQLTGWTLQEASGRPLAAVFHIINDKTRQSVESPLEKVLREGRTVGLANHTLLVAKDGTERPIEDSGAPIRNEGGAPAGVVLVFKDASARYAAEREIAESEARFRALADNIPILCWMADKTGAVFWYNNRWYEYTGATLEQTQGWGWQSVHDTAILPSVMQRWTLSIESGLPFEMVFPLRGANGAFRDFLTRVAPVRNEHGQIVRWFGSNTDVTDQRAAEAALREADHRKDEFLAILAHELRNPLAPIRNAVRLLNSDVPIAAQARARAIIERQSSQMTRLLDDLLDVSRITRGVIELRREVFDLWRTVEDVILANEALIERLHHKIVLYRPDAPLMVDADPARMHQALDNLVQNAAKYTDPGGRIEVSASDEADAVVLSVGDTGIGLSPESLERVFDLFSQIHPSDRSHSGLGIGLAIVKHIVTLHNGTIKAASAGLGRGSRFSMTIPKATCAPRPDPGPPEQLLARFRGSLRVLLVDDQPDILESLSLVLQGNGFSVHTAEDGVIASHIAETLRPDIMIVDLGMPKMDGFEVARWVRQQPWGMQTRLIAVTGWGQDDDRRRTRDAGFDHHLVKPVDPDTLMSFLKVPNESSASRAASPPTVQ